MLFTWHEESKRIYQVIEFGKTNGGPVTGSLPSPRSDDVSTESMRYNPLYGKPKEGTPRDINEAAQVTGGVVAF